MGIHNVALVWELRQLIIRNHFENCAVVNLSMVLRDLCGGLLSIFCPFKIQKMKKTKNMNFYTNSDVCYQEFFIFGKSLKWKDRIKKRYTT